MWSLTYTEYEPETPKRDDLWAVSMRGCRTSYYNDRDEAETLYRYLRKHFGHCSLNRVQWKRFAKNLRMSRI